MVEFKTNTAYHAETEEEAIWLLTEADKQGYEWRSGCSFLNNVRYQQDRCYYPIEGQHSDLEWAKNNHYNIIKIKHLITEKQIELW